MADRTILDSFPLRPKSGSNTLFTVACKVWEPLGRICENVNNFKTKERDHTKCMLFFISTVLSKIFYIKYVTYSPQDKTIAEIIQITPFKSLGTLGS